MGDIGAHAENLARASNIKYQPFRENNKRGYEGFVLEAQRLNFFHLDEIPLISSCKS